MRKILFSIIALTFLFLFSARISFARWATCDACGLCPNIVNDPADPSCVVTKEDPNDASKTINLFPGDWRRCVKCLYGKDPPAAPALPTCDTLLINEETNLPVNPVKAGTQFTLLGCITSGTQVGFDKQTGASSFVQVLLNVIFSFAGGLAFLYLMYGGFIILTSQADPERLNYGRRLIYGAIAGLIITIGSVFIVNLVGSGILHIPGFG